MKLEIVTKTAKVVDAEVESVFLPGYEGEMGVLPEHAPLLTKLGIGELRYREQGKVHTLALSHGFAEILGQRLIILADTAERPDEIDVEEAKETMTEAEKTMESVYGNELVEARDRLELSRIRIAVAERKDA